MRSGCNLISARRSAIRRATSPCSHGGASAARARRRNWAATAASSSRRAPDVSGSAMGGQYIDPMLFSRLVDASRAALRRAVPTQCAICHGWGDDRVCTTCRRHYAAPVARCERCALQVPETITVCGGCLREPPPYDSALAALAYAHPWDRLIAPFKFHAALDLGPALARCLVDAWTERQLPHPGLLLPVPLSMQRQR